MIVTVADLKSVLNKLPDQAEVLIKTKDELYNVTGTEIGFFNCSSNTHLKLLSGLVDQKTYSDDLLTENEGLKELNNHYKEVLRSRVKMETDTRRENEEVLELCGKQDFEITDLKEKLAKTKEGLKKIVDSCQCETDDRDVCFHIAVKCLSEANSKTEYETILEKMNIEENLGHLDETGCNGEEL